MKLSAHLLAKLAVAGVAVAATGACGPIYGSRTATSYPVVIEPVVIEPAHGEPVQEPQYAKPPPGDVRATPPTPVVVPVVEPDPDPIDIDDCPGCGMG